MDSVLQEMRLAVRGMRKAWIFSSVVVLSLALGIGANTTVFTLIDAVLWRTLPVNAPEDLVAITRTENENVQTGHSYQQFRGMQENTHVAELAGYSPQRIAVSIDGKLEPTADAHLVSGNYFSLLGVNPVAGRTITAQDDRLGSDPVAMISHRYWTRRFDRDPSTIGRTVSLSGTPARIIGVTTPEFFGVEAGAAPDIFVPMILQPRLMPTYENLLLDNPSLYLTWIQIIGRLQPGWTFPRAEAALEPAFLQNFPAPKGGRVRPKVDLVMNSAATGIFPMRSEFSRSLVLVMALVGMVLLIACANIANLFLARAESRRGEFALRLAIGAGSLRLTRQLLVEATLLAVLGGVGAIVVSQWATQMLLLLMSAGQSAVVLDITPNFRVLLFTAFLSVATGAVFAAASALRATRVDLGAALKRLRGLGGRRAAGPRKVLAIAQVSLSLILLIGAGLFVRSLQNLNGHDDGFPRSGVLIVRVEPAGSDQRNKDGMLPRLHATYSRLLDRVRAIPGVRSASLANVSPLKPSSGCCGFLAPGASQPTLLPQVMIYPDYFQTMGIAFVGGRDFERGEFDPNAPRLVIVNETLARTLFNGEDAIGKSLDEDRIIGVVRDSKYTSLKGETQPTAYKPFLKARTGRGQMILHVRTMIDPESIAGRLREEVWNADPTASQFAVHTLAEEVDAVLVRERLLATLSSVLGALALILVSIGLYGVLAFVVVQRTAEMGLRAALGAQRRNVVGMVLREAFAVVIGGIAIGIPAALVMIRIGGSQISGLLFGLKPGDPLTIGMATALLLLIAALAGYIPARRASRVDPAVALRSE